MVIKMNLLKIIKDFFGLDKSNNGIEEKTEIDLDKCKYERAKSILLKEKSYFKNLDNLQQDELIKKLIKLRECKLESLKKSRGIYKELKKQCSIVKLEVIAEFESIKSLKKYFLDKNIDLDKMNNLNEVKEKYLALKGIDIDNLSKLKTENYYLFKLKNFNERIQTMTDELESIKSEKIVISSFDLESRLINYVKKDKEISNHADCELIVSVMLKNPEKYKKEIDIVKQEYLQEDAERISQKIISISKSLKLEIDKKQEILTELEEFKKNIYLIKSCEEGYDLDSKSSHDGHENNLYESDQSLNRFESTAYYQDPKKYFKNIKGYQGYEQYVHQSKFFVRFELFEFNEDLISEKDLELLKQYETKINGLRNFLCAERKKLHVSDELDGYLKNRSCNELFSTYRFIDDLKKQYKLQNFFFITKIVNELLHY